ncbi:hypothetical protein [Desulfosporosinus nitroreducens]|uniref:hypothetical protein n=1 Tax=Desulfosporosinus nitroreducens TaxID=2018668 RepID=UPI00207C6FD0|nr:hypothetical protein [Desulfosporosinus nitroreducens]MCO1599788.1 hypothetical protein [Desulfosporosinus nitroreducens]
MASIRKRPSGSYQATIYAGVNTEGKRIMKYFTRKTLKEAKIAAREFEQAHKIPIGDDIVGKHN